LQGKLKLDLFEEKIVDEQIFCKKYCRSAELFAENIADQSAEY